MVFLVWFFFKTPVLNSVPDGIYVEFCVLNERVRFNGIPPVFPSIIINGGKNKSILLPPAKDDDETTVREYKKQKKQKKKQTQQTQPVDGFVFFGCCCCCVCVCVFVIYSFLLFLDFTISHKKQKNKQTIKHDLPYLLFVNWVKWGW